MKTYTKILKINFIFVRQFIIAFLILMVIDMNDNFHVDSFFKPIRLERPVSEEEYTKILPYIKTLEGLARIANMSLYLTDYVKREFLYVSSNPLFLCGYERDEVKKMGYEFYPKVVNSADLKMLLEVNEKGFEFFYKQEPEIRSSLFISYDFRMNHKNGSVFMINHKLTPFALNCDGDIWLSLSFVSLSTQESPGNVYIQQFNPSNRMEYSFKSKRWKKTYPISLTNRELEILRLSAQGYTAQGIAEKLFIDIATVKFHKTNILSKFKVNNTMEAVYFASTNHII